MPRDLNNFSKEELIEFLNSFDNIFCDCDGVIFFAFKPIDGSVSALNALKNLGKYVRYISNNAALSVDQFSQTLNLMGLDTETKDVILPVDAIISHLKEINFKRKLHVIGCGTMKKELTKAGYELVNNDPYTDIQEKADTIIKHIVDDVDVGAVVFDIDINMNFIRLQKAITYLKRPDVLFLTGCSDSQLPISEDIVLIGPSYFQSAVEDVTGKKPLRFGKPGKNLSEYVANRFNINPRRTLMIGDGFSDMIFARECGYQKMMVFTGVVKRKDVENCQNQDMLPDYYINSLKDFKVLLDGLEQ